MAVIEKVIKGLEFCTSTTGCTGCPYEDPCHDIEQRILGEAIMRDALERLKEQQPKWIPVDERLPEEDGFYLVCNSGFLPWIAELRTFMGTRGWCNGANMPVVKMWMPLPRTPKDGEQE